MEQWRRLVRRGDSVAKLHRDISDAVTINQFMIQSELAYLLRISPKSDISRSSIKLPQTVIL